MIMTCPDCSTRYTVDAKALGESGRQVRCASCGHKWFAQPEPDAVDQTDASEPPPTEEAEPIAEDLPTDETQSEEGLGQSGVDDLFSAPLEEPDDLLSDTLEDKDENNESHENNEPLEPTPPHRAYRNRLEGKAKRKRRLIAAAAWAGVAASLMLISALAIVNRTAMVKAMPGTAGLFAFIGLPVNVWGVDFKGVASERSRENADDVLRISGELYNAGKKPRPVPLVRVSLRDETGEELYAWTVEAALAELPAKTGTTFKTETRNPPTQAVDIRFSLTNSPLTAALQHQETALLRSNDH